jgi:hypothetical protein
MQLKSVDIEHVGAPSGQYHHALAGGSRVGFEASGM